MFNSKFLLLQYLIAGHPRTNLETLTTLAASPHVCIRRRVAENIGAPASVLRDLLNDEDTEVRQNLATNSALPLVFLFQLALDENLDVRYAMAEDTVMPEHILKLLSRDENPYVAHRAAQTIERQAEEPFFAMAS